MTAFSVVILLLGASAVLGALPSCEDLKALIKKRNALKSASFGDFTPEVFKKIVRFKLEEPFSDDNIFVVKNYGERIPTLKVDNKNYQLLLFRVIRLEKSMPGTGVLAVAFHRKRSELLFENLVIILVPLISDEENDDGINAELNDDLRKLGTLGTNEYFDTSVSWIKDNLQNAERYTVDGEKVKHLLFGCEQIADPVLSLFHRYRYEEYLKKVEELGFKSTLRM